MQSQNDVQSCRLNFMDTINFPLLIQRILCISPFIRDGKKLISSHILTAYSICVMVGYVILIAVSIIQIKSVGFDWLDLSQGYLWIIIVCFELIFTVISFPLLLLFCLLSKHLQMKLLLEMSKIDDDLIQEFGVDFNHVYLRFVINQRVEIFSCSAYFAYIFYLLHCALQNHELSSLGFYIFAVAYVLEQYVCALLFWSLSNTALMLRSKLYMLTEIQENMYQNPSDNLRFTKRKLSTLMVTFKDICLIIDLISHSIGSMFVLQMAHDFTLLTSQCYIIFYIVTKSRSARAITVIMHIMVWMVQNVLRIGVTAVTMSGTVDEVCLWMNNNYL